MGSRSGSETVSRLGPLAKAALAVRIWSRFLLVQVMLRREPLPALVSRLGRPRRRSRRRFSHALLARAVSRSLHVGGRRPTCLVSSLVLYRLLRQQGDPAELVIGLDPENQNQKAHAWIELDGRDVGPPPGRGSHEALARFN